MLTLDRLNSFVVFHAILGWRFYLYPKAFKAFLEHPVESSYLCAWLQAFATCVTLRQYIRRHLVLLLQYLDARFGDVSTELSSAPRFMARTTPASGCAKPLWFCGSSSSFWQSVSPSTCPLCISSVSSSKRWRHVRSGRGENYKNG